VRVSEWVGIAVTAVLTLVGLYFANSLRLRTRAEIEKGVAEKRFEAYAKLWAHTKVASPMRGSPLTETERKDLYRALTDWYYDDGNGMLLTEQTRNIYLNAKRNLTSPDIDLVPETLATRVLAANTDRELIRGQASIDQLSILRTSMRADIRIFTEPYKETLKPEDKAFLTSCKVDLTRQPWHDAVAHDSGQHHDA
jgi:hypothetical protein